MEYNFPQVKENSLLGRAYQLIDPLMGGKTTDDSPISVRLMMRNIVTMYGEVLREDFIFRQDRGETPSDQLFQDYTCENLENVEDCDECGKGIVVKRFKLPRLASFAGSPLIKWVGTSTTTFEKISSLREAVSLSKGKPFNPGRPGYWLSGDYAFVSLPERLALVSKINYSIVPQDPSSSEACFNIWAEDFPIDNYIWSIVANRIKAGEGNIYLNTMQRIDVVNNGRPDNDVS